MEKIKEVIKVIEIEKIQEDIEKDIKEKVMED